MAPLGLLAFALFYGRACDLAVTYSLQELRCLDFAPLGAGTLKECGESGMPMRWGAQRDPSKPTGEQVLRSLQD